MAAKYANWDENFVLYGRRTEEDDADEAAAAPTGGGGGGGGSSGSNDLIEGLSERKKTLLEARIFGKPPSSLDGLSTGTRSASCSPAASANAGTRTISTRSPSGEENDLIRSVMASMAG